MKNAVKEKLRSIELKTTKTANSVRDYVSHQVENTADALSSTDVYKQYFQVPGDAQKNNNRMNRMVSMESLSSLNSTGSPNHPPRMDFSLGKMEEEPMFMHTDIEGADLTPNSGTKHSFNPDKIKMRAGRLRRNSSSVYFETGRSIETKNSSESKKREKIYIKGVEHSGTFSPKSLERFPREKKSNGKLSIRLRSAKGLEKAGISGKVFAVLEVENDNLVCPMVFPDENGCYTWEIRTDFDVVDIFNSDLRVLIYKSNYLMSDTLIGQILVPVSWLLQLPPLIPVLVKEKEIKSELSAWFEIFPCVSDRQKYQPAFQDSPGSGLDRPQPSLGRVLLDLSFCPDSELLEGTENNVISRKKLFELYLQDLDTTKKQKDSSSFGFHRNLLGQTLSQVYDLKRHISRIFRVKDQIISFIKEVLNDFTFIRKFEYPFISVFVYAAAYKFFAVSEYSEDGEYIGKTYRELDLDLWQLPFFAYGYVLLKSLHHRYISNKTERGFILWNHETEKIPSDLTSTQQLLKLGAMLDFIEGFLRGVTDTLEKLVNALNWSDEFITSLLLAGLLLVSLVFASIIYAASLIPFTYVCLLYLLFPFELLGRLIKSIYALVYGNKRKRRKKPRAKRNDVTLTRPSLYSLLKKIPTHDVNGHKFLCKLQILETEYQIDAHQDKLKIDTGANDKKQLGSK
eukprot:snap_masked-scaffold_4-processed-gene-13.24-mRNA-1 protein AED:1.00 eAED:1.00 QI:0/-1/0/0/-1/1/1/0/681